MSSFAAEDDRGEGHVIENEELDVGRGGLGFDRRNCGIAFCLRTVAHVMGCVLGRFQCYLLSQVDFPAEI